MTNLRIRAIFGFRRVFEGGGVKGMGLVGAVAVAEERGYQWVNLDGTSAGAIVAALLAAGYSATGYVFMT